MKTPRYDSYLEEMIMNQKIDNTTIAATYFDAQGTLMYPWRKEVEAIAGPERHTIRMESRSWAINDKKASAAIRILSDYDLMNSKRNGVLDHYMLAEIGHSYLIRLGRLSVDRLCAVIGVIANVIQQHQDKKMEYFSALVCSSDFALQFLSNEQIPFDGKSIEENNCDCIGSLWGLYDIPDQWDDVSLARATKKD